jgi:hypothetical protein
MNKFNLKNFWREILIGILIALLLWISSADRPQVTTIGNSDTICVTDTVTNDVPGATLVKYVRVKVPIITGPDTSGIWDYLLQNQEYVTLPYTFDDSYFQTPHITKDTAWMYADIPQNEYMDTSFFVRTIGWMDSISIFLPKTVKTETVNYPPLSSQLSIFANTHLGNGVVAPGVSVSVRKLQLGYNYNVVNQSSLVTLGYRIR